MVLRCGCGAIDYQELGLRVVRFCFFFCEFDFEFLKYQFLLQVVDIQFSVGRQFGFWGWVFGQERISGFYFEGLFWQILKNRGLQNRGVLWRGIVFVLIRCFWGVFLELQVVRKDKVEESVIFVYFCLFLVLIMFMIGWLMVLQVVGIIFL